MSIRKSDISPSLKGILRGDAADCNATEFIVAFESLTAPDVRGVEHGAFSLPAGLEECDHLNRFYDGKVNHFLVPTDSLCKVQLDLVEQRQRLRGNCSDQSHYMTPPEAALRDMNFRRDIRASIQATGRDVGQ